MHHDCTILTRMQHARNTASAQQHWGGLGCAARVRERRAGRAVSWVHHENVCVLRTAREHTIFEKRPQDAVYSAPAALALSASSTVTVRFSLPRRSTSSCTRSPGLHRSSPSNKSPSLFTGRPLNPAARKGGMGHNTCALICKVDQDEG